MTPKDHHLFRDVNTFLNGNIFADADREQAVISHFFHSKKTDILPQLYLRVTNHFKDISSLHGEYFVDKTVSYVSWFYIFHCSVVCNTVS